MLSKLSRFLTIATITTLTCVITHPANADNQSADMMPSTFDEYNVEETFNEAFWRHDGNFFQDTRPGRFFTDTMFGLRHFPLGSYPENEVARDGLLIYTILNDYYKQLAEDNPTLRTRDLANPFDLSLRDDLDTFEEEYPVRVYQPQYPVSEPLPPSEPVRGLY